jgi:hypothetical protein
MTKSLIFITVLTLLVGCRSSIETFQTSDKNKIGVKSNRFRGTVFTTSYQTEKFFIPTADSINKFTPTKEDIAIAENILQEQIGEVNKRHINQFGKHQYIDRNLSKYFRQYIGYIDKNGDRTIHLNLHWDRYTLKDRIKGYWDDRLDYTSDYTIVFDGGSRYWSVNVNLNSKTLFGLSVNGVA